MMALLLKETLLMIFKNMKIVLYSLNKEVDIVEKYRWQE